MMRDTGWGRVRCREDKPSKWLDYYFYRIIKWHETGDLRSGMKKQGIAGEVYLLSLQKKDKFKGTLRWRQGNKDTKKNKDDMCIWSCACHRRQFDENNNEGINATQIMEIST